MTAFLTTLSRAARSPLFAGGIFVVLVAITVWSAPAREAGSPLEEASGHMHLGMEVTDGSCEHSTYACHALHLNSAFKTGGIEGGMALIRSIGGDTPSILDCHMLMHKLGMLAYHQTRDIDATLSHVGTYCWSGYLHGALEGYLLDERQEGVGSIATVCDRFRGQDFAIVWECTHGIGHALMYFYKNDIFKSVAGCDLLEAAYAKERCYFGVFMENAYEHSNVYGGPPKKFIRGRDTLYPYTELAER